MPKISVIVPVYKVEPYLHRCVDSILNQTFTDFELILVDDGSPDNCPAICDEYAEKDDRVQVIHQANGGLSAARNAGIDRAFANSDSQWINFVDSDDWVDMHYLETLYSSVAEGKADICACGFSEKRNISSSADIAAMQTPKIVSFEDYYCTKWEYVNLISSCGKIYRKSAFAHIRFPIGKINEDIFTTYRLLFMCSKVAVIDQPLYTYYVGEANSIMRASWTPNRLAEIEGYEEMISFMETHDFEQAQRKMIDTYFWSLDRQIKMLQAPEAVEYEEYRTQLVKKLSDAIKKYRKMVPVTLRERHWLIEDVHPNMMKVYWKVHAILSERS